MNFVAQNEKKLERAMETLRKQGVSNPTDEQVRELYVKYGGRIIGDRSTERGTDESALIHLVEPEGSESAPEVVEAQPVRTGRRRAA